MFDDDVADQRILAWGRAVCAASDDPQRKRALVEDVDTSRLSEALVFLCPEVVGRQEPERLRSQAQVRQDAVDYHSKTGEEYAICVTVKAFDAAPPLRLKGWEQVTEVGIRSRSGRLVVPPNQEDGEEPTAPALPNMAAEGPGTTGCGSTPRK